MSSEACHYPRVQEPIPNGEIWPAICRPVLHVAERRALGGLEGRFRQAGLVRRNPARSACGRWTGLQIGTGGRTQVQVGEIPPSEPSRRTPALYARVPGTNAAWRDSAIGTVTTYARALRAGPGTNAAWRDSAIGTGPCTPGIMDRFAVRLCRIRLRHPVLRSNTYPFNAPAVRPLSSRRWNNTYTTRVGTMVMVIAAKRPL